MKKHITTTRDSLWAASENLFRSSDRIEFIVPTKLDTTLIFHVSCNGAPVAQAILEGSTLPTINDPRVVDLFANRNRATFELKSIQVDPSFRNRGIGSVLLQEIIHWCQHNQILRLTGTLAGELPSLRRWCNKNHIRVTAQDEIDQNL